LVALRSSKQGIIRRHARADDVKAATQVLTTLACFALAWAAAVWSFGVSVWLTVAAGGVISLFTLRVFTLMHECGHRSLFRTQRLNRACGFLLGVLSGMPQYVWSKHHQFHHDHNGDWEVYRGPYATRSVQEYAAMTTRQRWMYRLKCHLAAAPVVGFVYLIFNPRFTWLKGTVQLGYHVLTRRITEPHLSMAQHAASFTTRYWQSDREYRHMAANNVVLLTLWALMCWAIGPVNFFAVYVASVSLAGGAGIVLFAVQHNFEHAYASGTEHWDRDAGAMYGTSFLILPRWLNWFTTNIAYHHVHHLSAQIPNYRLVSCHTENEGLFSDVTRLKLRHVRHALRYMLWDQQARRIISLAEYDRQSRAAAVS